jgi:hypothetical protein
MPLNKDAIFRKIKTARWDLIIVFSAARLPATQSIVITHPTSGRPGFIFRREGRVIKG